MKNSEIAKSYELWREYMDAGHNMSELEFNALSVEDRMALLVECFGNNEE